MNAALQRPDKQAPGSLVWAALGVVYLAWGSTYLAIRVTVETMPPLLASAARFLIAGSVMYLFLVARRGRSGIRVTTGELAASAAVGAALLLGANGLVMIAEQEVPSALAALIIASTPLWVVILRLVFRDRVTRGTLAGVAAGFVGVAILVLPGNGSSGAPLGGALLLVAASAFWATGSFFSKRLPLPNDPFVSTAMQMLCGGLLLTVVGVAAGEAANIDVASFSTRSVVALAYLVVIGSLLAFTSYTWVLQHAPISKVATYAYVNPVVAIFLGWVILSEQITGTILFGAAVIVASVAFIVRKESQPAVGAEQPAEPAGEPAVGQPAAGEAAAAVRTARS